MNNLFKKIATAFVGIAMAVGVGVAVGKGSVRGANAIDSGDRITSVADIENNATYYIGATVSNTDYYFKASSYAVGSGIQGTSTTSTDDAAVVKLIGSDNTWAIQLSNGNYLSLPSSKNNGKVDIVSSADNWSITDSNSLLLFAINGYQLKKNSSTSLNFGSYQSGQTALWLELVGHAASGYSLTYNANAALNIGGLPSKATGLADGTTQTLSSDVPTRFGYTFGGWAATADSTTPITSVTIDGSDVIVYAIWTADLTVKGAHASNPYTVAEAMAAIDAGTHLDENYVQGYISQIDSFNSTYKSLQYWISDDGTTTSQLEVYSGKGLDGADFTATSDIELGAEVVICGTLKMYNSTYEFDKTNYQVSYVAPTPVVVTHIVTLKSGQGSGDDIEVSDITDGSEYTLPENPFTAPTGKVFAGWAVSTDATKVYEVGEKITVTSDVELTAQWEDAPVYYTVTYSDGAQGTHLVENILEGSKHALLALADAGFEVPDGKVFAGWQVGDDAETKQPATEITVNGNVTVTAIFEDAQQAPVPASLVVTYSGANPKVGEALAEDLVVKIKYSDDSVGTEDIAEDCEFYILVNNQEQEVGPNTVFETAGEVTIYARYSGNLTAPITGSVVITVEEAQQQTVEFDVTFDYATQGKTNAVVKVEENQKVTKPEDPTKDGFDFAGWYLGEELYDFNTPVTQAITLVAHWTEKVTPQPSDDYTLLTSTSISQLTTSKKVVIALEDKSKGVTGFNNKDAVVSEAKSEWLEFDVTAVDATEGTYSLKDASTGKWISTNASNEFKINADAQTTLKVDETGHFAFVDSNSVERWLGVNGNYIRCYATTSSNPTAWYYVFMVSGGSVDPQPTTQYTISFDHGAGTGTIADLVKDAGSVIESAPASTFTAPEGKEFDKWVDGDGNAIVFPYTVNANATFYASYKDSTQPGPGPVDPVSTDPIVLDGTKLAYTDVSGGETAVTTKTVDNIQYVASAGARSYTLGNGTHNFSSGNMLMLGKKNAYIYNQDALPAGISKIEVVTNGMVGEDRHPSTNVKMDIAFGKSVMTTALTGEGTQLNAEDTVFTFIPSESGCTFFRLQIMSEHNAQFQMKIYFGDPAQPASPTGISLDKTTASVEVGKTVTLTASLTPSGATGTITWETSDATVATVANGVVTGVKAGSATITAKCGTLSATCAVTVTEASGGQTDEKGSKTNPYTVSEAWALIDALADGANNGKVVYVTGTVSGEVSFNSNHNSGTFLITDGTKTIKAYSIGGVSVTEGDSNYVADGYTVVVGGALIKYGSGENLTYEVGYASGFQSELVSTTPGQGGGGETPVSYTVTFNSDGGSAVAAQTVESGAKATQPADPTKEGYTFDGWYNGETKFDFNTAITGNITLTAHWTQNGGGETPTAKTVTKIEVSGFDKLQYTVGQELDLSELKVLIYYSDGTFDIATADQIKVEGYDKTKAGQQEVKVSVGDKSWTVKVMVTTELGCHGSVVAGSALISLTTLLGAGLLMFKKRKED